MRLMYDDFRRSKHEEEMKRQMKIIQFFQLYFIYIYKIKFSNLSS